jgi:hypothetical protein
MKAAKVILAILTGALLGAVLEFINLAVWRLLLPPFILLPTTILVVICAGSFISTRFVVAVLIAIILAFANVVAALFSLAASTMVLMAGPVLIFLVGCIYLALIRARKKAASGDYDIEHLPACAREYIESVIRNMRYRKKVRSEVREELAGNFEDALWDLEDEYEKEKTAERLTNEFGNEKLLATLIRRGKKRCRPLWLKGLIRTCQAAGLLIALFCLYTVWFTCGRCAVDIDYLAIMNQMGRAGISKDDNAWPYYEKARELYVQPEKWMKKFIRSQWIKAYKRPEEPDEATKAALVKWIQENEAAWRQFAIGSLEKRCSAESGEFGDEEEKWLIGLVYPSNTLSDLLRLGRWRLWRHLEQNQIPEVIEDSFIILKAARNLQGQNNFLYEHLIGQLYIASACEALAHIAASEQLSAVDLQKVQQQLLQISPQDYPHWNPEPIRTIFLDTVQRTFTDGGAGGGHMIPGRLRDFYALHSSLPKWDIKKPLPFYIAASMAHAGRDETIARYDELFESLSRDLKTSPYQRAAKKNHTAKLVSTLDEQRYSLIHHLLIKVIPNMLKRADMRYQTITKYEAVITIFALKRWQREKGEYPEKLAELVKAGYLKEIPYDPYSDRALRYERRQDDFILYSVGPNFEDDGGVFGKDEEGQVKMWADEGDAVFWPVQ